MNTSTEAVNRLQKAQAATKDAANVIDNLIVSHDYQDVASLVMQAANALLETATLLMQSNDKDALDYLERAEDIIDSIYDIIDSDLDED